MRWRVVLGTACLAAWAIGAGGGGSTGFPLFPQGVAELLSHAAHLWRSRVLAPFGAPTATVLAIGDLTGDGGDDVVVSDHQAIFVFESQRGGSFRERPVGFYEVQWAEDRRYYTVIGAVKPLSASLADLDGDGALDLVVGTSGSRHEIHLFRNTGRGGLAKVEVLNVPHAPHELWVVDFTGDGVLDIVWFVGTSIQAGQLFLHAGAEGFAFGNAVALASVDGRPLGLADLDGDRVLDFAFYASRGVGVRWGTERGFAKETFWESTAGKVNHGVLHPKQAGTAVLATDQGVVVLKLERGGLTVQSLLPLGPCTWVYLVDLTGDGWDDALVLGRGVWAMLPGSPEGSFLHPTSEFLFPGPLALARNSLSTLRLGDETALVVGITPFPTLFRTGRPPAGETLIPIRGSYLLAVGDLSGNGAPDLVAEGATGVDVLWNDGRGALVRRPLVEAALQVIRAAVGARGLYLLGLAEQPKGRMAMELLTVSPVGDVLACEILEVFAPPASNTVQPVLGLGDFDADGEEDVLLLREDAVLVKWGREGWQHYPWEEGRLGLAVTGRFTQTALPEVALLSDAGLFYLTFPSRRLAAQKGPLALEGFPLAIAQGDLDGDGLDDLVLTTLDVEAEVSLEKGKLSVRILGVRGVTALSSGKVRSFAVPPLGEEDVPWPLTGLVVADLTGDGVIDVAFTTTQGAGVFVLPGRGDGTFAEPVRIPRRIGPLFTADLDGNGQAELVGSTLGFNPYLWIRWNGGER